MLNYWVYLSDLGAERLLKLIDASTNGVSLVQLWMNYALLLIVINIQIITEIFRGHFIKSRVK